MSDRSKCPCGCGRQVRSSLKEFYNVTLETRVMPDLLDRFEALPNANNTDRFRRSTADLHSRLVDWCHEIGPSGARAGIELGRLCGEWRKVMNNVLLAVTLADRAFAFDWVARASGIDSPGWQPDPYRRARFRYHDGDHWTAYVSEGQTTQTEPDGWQDA